jgi:hypothetical protein
MEGMRLTLRAHSVGAFFCPQSRAKKPGFPLQVLGSADALPVGFPLQSLAQAAAQNQLPELPEAIPGQQIAFGNLLRVTRRSQFCSDKIACSVTKHVA